MMMMMKMMIGVCAEDNCLHTGENQKSKSAIDSCALNNTTSSSMSSDRADQFLLTVTMLVKYLSLCYQIIDLQLERKKNGLRCAIPF